MTASPSLPVRVALVEDAADLRRRFRERAQFYETLDLCCVAVNGAHLFDELAACPPDRRPHVVLMDIEMPVLGGIEATRRLRAEHPDIEVMMLTVFEDADKIFEAIQAGASGYLLKDTSMDALAEAVLDLARGGAPLSPSIARKTLALMRHAPATGADAFNLSEREIDVLRAVVDDATEQEIAEALFISPHTVRTHVKNIYRKLHVRSRAGAVRLALERRLV